MTLANIVSFSGTPQAYLHPIRSLGFDQVQVQVQVAPITPESMGAFLASEEVRIRQLLKSRDSEVPRRAVVVLDGSNQLIPPPAARRIQADWMRKNAHVLRAVIHSMGIVIPNALARAAFTALMWLAGDRVPWQIVAHPDLQTAVDWAIREAHSIGGTVSSDLILEGVDAVERKRLQLTAGARAGKR